MSEELKPCPFCGMNYAENAWDEYGSEYWVCEFCGAASGTERDEYIWNTRPIEDALNARIAELEAEAKAAKENSQWLARLTESSRKENEHLRQTLSVYAAKQRWISVSERLPDNWKSVLTIDISKSTRDMVTAFYSPETSRWSTHVPNYDLWVTHWMPLPEPPIVYGKVCD